MREGRKTGAVLEGGELEADRALAEQKGKMEEFKSQHPDMDPYSNFNHIVKNAIMVLEYALNQADPRSREFVAKFIEELDGYYVRMNASPEFLAEQLMSQRTRPTDFALPDFPR